MAVWQMDGRGAGLEGGHPIRRLSHSPYRKEGRKEKWTDSALVLEVTQQSLGVDGMFRVGGN